MSNPDLKTTRFRRNEDIIASEVDNEIVMMDVSGGRYFGMDSVGAALWNCLDQPKDLNTLVDELCSKYDVSSHKCREDIKPFLQALLEKKLIEAMD